MSETDFLKLKKHDNVETNTEKFDIENYLNGNWDKINENAKKVNTDISNINSKNKEQDTNIEQLQENTEISSNKIAELEKELKEAQEDFYQASIRGQASGEYIHVEDSSNCRARIGIGGNHEQETRSGKNCIPNNLIDGTTNGIKYTIDSDKAINLSGTATARTEPKLFYNTTNPLKFKAGTYKNTSDLLIILRCDTYISIPAKSTVVLSEDKEVIEAYFRIEQGETVSGKHYPQIIVNGQDESYEQYGASPSPDYQSEVESVGSNINILPSNLFSSKALNGINYTNKDGIITVNGTATENSFYTKTITLKAGTYTLNGAPKGSAQDRYCLQAQGLGAGDFGSGQTFTIDTEKQVTLRIMVWKGITVNNIIFKPKLIKGTEVGEYSKHGQGCVKVTKCNKNIMPILNLGNNYEYTGNGIKNLKKNDGVEVTRFKVRKGQTIKFGLKLFSRPTQDTSWTIYFENTGIASFAHLENSSSFDLNKVYEKTYTASTDGEIFIKLWGNANSDVFEFQLWAELDNLTEYEQHEEQSYIIPMQTEMLENDYLDYDNEEEVHIWGKKILDGTENWAYEKLTSADGEKNNFYLKIDDAMSNGKVCSNAFIQRTSLADNYSMFMSAGKNLNLRYQEKSSSTEFKAYLKSQYDAGTPVVVYYQLETPIRLKFTDEQKAVAKELNNARTYKNVTNITTDSKAILSLDYAKDLETQNQKIQNEIDEIKQLLSTTQTSALLLDNMQTDIESEVE